MSDQDGCPGCINSHLTRLQSEKNLRIQAQNTANETNTPQGITPEGQIVAYPFTETVIERFLPTNKP